MERGIYLVVILIVFSCLANTIAAERGVSHVFDKQDSSIAWCYSLFRLVVLMFARSMVFNCGLTGSYC